MSNAGEESSRMSSNDGHTGLEYKKIDEVTSGRFVTALSYLKLDRSHSQYVIHLTSTTFYIDGRLQPSRMDGVPGAIFPELLGFKYFDDCNILSQGKCHYKIIIEVDPETLDRSFGFVRSINESYRRFATDVDSIFESLRTLDTRLGDLGITLPNWEMKSMRIEPGEKVYPKGFAYEFYHDVSELAKRASKEIFLIDSYPNEDVIDLYLAKVNIDVPIRIVLKQPKDNFLKVAAKFKATPERKLEVRQSADCHDRFFFIDGACYCFGQSMKDAGKKPTYLVQIQSYHAFRSVFEDMWNKAQPLGL